MFVTRYCSSQIEPDLGLWDCPVVGVTSFDKLDIEDVASSDT